MADEAQKPVDTVRMYTRARKFPLLIGRFPDGKQVPGGPYTLPQLVGGVIALAALWFLRPLWAHFGTIMNLGLAAMIAAGVVYGLGRLPQTGRSPWSRLGGLGKAASRSPKARVNGRTITIRRPHTVRGPVTITDSRANGPIADVVDRSIAQHFMNPDTADIAAAWFGVASSPPPTQDSTPVAPVAVDLSAISARSVDTGPRAPQQQVAAPLQEHRASRSASSAGRRRRAASAPSTAAPPWAQAPVTRAGPPETELISQSSISPGSATAAGAGAEKPQSSPPESGPSQVPRVRAAAGTGVAQLLALAADAQRKQ